MSERKIGVILSYVYTISQVLVNFIYIKLLLGMIGQSEYGLYQIVASLIAYLKIMQSGLSVGVSRFYCVYRSKEDKNNMENTLAIAQRIFYVLSVIVCILGMILIFGANEFYKTSFSTLELFETKIMLFILIINMVVDINNIIYVVSITAEEKFTFLKVIDLISVLIQPLVVLVVLYHIPYASIIVLIQLLINIIFSYIRKCYALNNLKTVIKYHNHDQELVLSLVKFSFITILALIADQIFWKADQLILGKMYGTTIVAIYSVGSQVYTNYMHFSTSISNVFMPKISKLYGDGTDIRPLSELFIKIGRIQFLILGMFLIVFILFGNEFITLWVGPGYHDAYVVAVVVMLSFTIDLIQNIGLTILQVANKYGFRAKMYFTIAILNIGSTIVLAKLYGPVGAAISTSLSMVIGSGFIMNYYYSTKVHLDIKHFWIEILKILVVDFPIFGLGYLVSLISLNNKWLQFLVHCSLTVGIYCLVNYFFTMSEYEKSIIKKMTIKLVLKNT